MRQPLAKRVVAEALGTFFLLAAVVGSGIMAERLANGNTALALLANTAATGAALIALIISFAPLSGAHFNPVVTLFRFASRLTLAGSCRLSASTSSGWNWRRCDGKSDVRSASGFLISTSKNWHGSTTQRVHSHARAGKCNSRRQPLDRCRCCGCRWCIHKRGLLVYSVNLVC